jgi:hypothetical protein
MEKKGIEFLGFFVEGEGLMIERVWVMAVPVDPLRTNESKTLQVVVIIIILFYYCFFLLWDWIIVKFN